MDAQGPGGAQVSPVVPLDLFVEVTDSSGARYRWDANQAPGSRLKNFSFRTKLGEGFSDASGQLARRIDKDYPDVQLVNDISVVGADSSVAYEGRLEALPRELTDAHSLGVTMAGWMTHSKDRKFQEIYVDRDLGGWGPMSNGRKIVVLGGNGSPFDPEQSIDPTDSTAGVATAITGAWASPFVPMAEAWYDAGPGLIIGAITTSWKREGANISAADTSWSWMVYASTDDKATSTDASSNQRSAGPGSVTLTATGGNKRYGLLQLTYSTSPSGSDSARFAVDWYKMAVYGAHGLQTYTGEPGEPAGVRASDVIKDIVRRFCPKLNTGGVQDTSYVIQHLAFKDRGFPYDAFLEVNKYHLWHLGVWENKTLHFRPYDMTDWDWEIRTDDPGTTFAPQGPSTDDVFNGIVVAYTDLVTGIKNVLTPATYATLADPDLDNPWTVQGISHWDEIELSSPTLEAQALQIGLTALASRNRPKAPGTITVRGYIRDRGGNRQPVWKVRAGDTIAVTNFPNDAPRLIHESSYDDESKTVTLSIDAPASALDAVLDRISVGRTARGLA